MSFNRSAPSPFGLSSKVSFSQKICLELAQSSRTSIQSIKTVALKKNLMSFNQSASNPVWIFSKV